MKTINVVYNNTTLASLSEGQVARLRCAGRTMNSDIVITFGCAGSIVYNGVKTDGEEGKVVTLHCAGKRMKKDIVVVATVSLDNFCEQISVILGQIVEGET